MKRIRQIILAFMLGMLPIQAVFAGDCDTPKVKKQLVSYVIYGYGIRFYNAPVVSFEKDLGMQMEIREIYKGKKDTLCAVKVTLNALHTKIPNTDAFEKFLYKNNKGLFDSWEHYDKSRTNMENILRIYAYNKWAYKKERLWHFEENETFSHLEQTEGLRFYRVKFGDVQKAVSSQDFLPIDLTYNFWDKFASFKKLEFECKANKDSTIYDFSERYTLKCSDLKFLPALEKNFKWITGKNLENKVAFNRGDDEVCKKVFKQRNARTCKEEDSCLYNEIKDRIYFSQLGLYSYNMEQSIRDVESQLDAQYSVRAVLQDDETLCVVQTKFKNERNIIDFAEKLFDSRELGKPKKTMNIENITRPFFFVVKSDGELKTDYESSYRYTNNWHNIMISLNAMDGKDDSNLEWRLFRLKQLEYSCHKHTENEISCEKLYALNQALKETMQYFSSDEAKWESYDLNENKEQINE